MQHFPQHNLLVIKNCLEFVSSQQQNPNLTPICSFIGQSFNCWTQIEPIFYSIQPRKQLFPKDFPGVWKVLKRFSPPQNSSPTKSGYFQNGFFLFVCNIINRLIAAKWGFPPLPCFGAYLLLILWAPFLPGRVLRFLVGFSTELVAEEKGVAIWWLPQLNLFVTNLMSSV